MAQPKITRLFNDGKYYLYAVSEYPKGIEIFIKNNTVRLGKMRYTQLERRPGKYGLWVKI